ncbi:two-component system LytT family response regulator [Chitinophaga dinghuensis]|uniref:Two-component system LytT family response regulator n=1 Tax=Chitinophaga dinghuensis TaxID=1539050 RepID=A0A327VJD4_9BACT|nr:LytTR family DNA-binding domain-containing protein [Chitinophaga dinghuensis]RAJ72790.1 two-component system LytT family response regulator [Chitinophaga dinghuensis]
MYDSAFQEEISTLLVDDETIAIQRLRHALQAFPQIKIIGEAHDGPSAIAFINAKRPALVFLDIRIPGFNGFDVLNHLTYTPLIVFVTAYEEYAVKAFEKNSIDYLLKPFDDARLAITIKRIIQHKANHTDLLLKIKQLVTEQHTTNIISTIPVKVGNKIQLVQVEEVLFFEAKDKYVAMHTMDGEKLIEYSLSYLESRLPPSFVRVHRGVIVHKLKIYEIQKYFKGTFIIVMQDIKRTKIKTAYSYYEIIKTKLLLP